MGQSFTTHAYRILSSTLFSNKLQPIIDFISYDPSQHDNKLLSEHLFEEIILQISSQTDRSDVVLALKVYNMIDQEVQVKHITIDLGQVPSLLLVQGLICKIEKAKMLNQADEFRNLQNQLQKTIESIDVKIDILGIQVIYDNFTEAHHEILKVEAVRENGPAQEAGLLSGEDYVLGANEDQRCNIVRFRDISEFAAYVREHEERQMSLWCYNLESEQVRLI